MRASRGVFETAIAPDILRLVPARLATHYHVLPLRLEDHRLVIAVSDRCSPQTVDDLRALLGYDLVTVPWSPPEIEEAIRTSYGVGAGTVEQLATVANGAAERSSSERVEDLERLAGESSIVAFVNQLLMQAHRDRATDIHLEPFADALRVRFRIDGLLYPVPVPAMIRRFHQAIVSRLKIMAQLDIAERRLPQDGRITVKIGQEEMDVRVSFVPTPHGESVDIRLLPGTLLYDLAELGLSPEHLALLERLIQQPHGIIFVTGPTGSGKTTTLYACLHRINTDERKILTIEDPIEYLLSGITQMQVHPKIGFTFAQGLRSMLRHDPDVMMVGEVRDSETAEITIRSALTGHLVFSTLHTNDAAGGVARLLDMGIEPYLVASSVTCFIAQRLVRVVWRHCRVSVEPSPAFAGELEAVGGHRPITVAQGRGCEQCKNTGYRGRTAIYECLPITAEIHRLIVRRPTSGEIKRVALAQGMRTLRQDGWLKAMQGITTPAEVVRVTSSLAVDDAEPHAHDCVTA